MNPVMQSFLENQFLEAVSALAGSDLVRLGLAGGPQLVIAEFHCRGLVRVPDGAIREADHFAVGFHFPADYLRTVRPGEILTLLAPPGVWHPNMGGPRHPTAICVGPITPGAPLLELLYRVHEMLTWQSYTPVEFDSLNPEACVWARANGHRLPVDPRPLRWSRAEGTFDEDGPAVGDLLEAMEVVE